MNDSARPMKVEINVRACTIKVHLRSSVVQEYYQTGARTWLKAGQPGYRRPETDVLIVDPDDWALDKATKFKLLVMFKDSEDCDRGYDAIAVSEILKFEVEDFVDHWVILDLPVGTRFGVIKGGEYRALDRRIKVVDAGFKPEPKSWWRRLLGSNS